MKPKILTFVSYYLPGYKAGGPLRTISNMVDHLGDEFEFWIVTRDRDLGDAEAYTSVPLNRWVTMGGAQVFYCSPEQQTVSDLAKVINEIPHDVLYLNSFFDPAFTLKPLLARFLGKLSQGPIVLAPRGEFSEEALKLKWFKKTGYILVARLFGWYKNVTWQASSEHEAEDIKRSFSVVNKDILVALDLPAKFDLKSTAEKYHNAASDSPSLLRIVFLSRISPMKNLDYALRVLSQVQGDVAFDIYGPLEDADYWQSCQALIREIPPNVQVEYCEAVTPVKVSETFARYDLFLFPTHGENYGHVIAESLSVGTPVLLSDQTPWRDLTVDGLGWDLALENMDEFVEVIELFSRKNKKQDQNEKAEIRRHVQSKALERLTNPAVLKANRELFISCLHL